MTSPERTAVASSAEAASRAAVEGIRAVRNLDLARHPPILAVIAHDDVPDRETVSGSSRSPSATPAKKSTPPESICTITCGAAPARVRLRRRDCPSAVRNSYPHGRHWLRHRTGAALALAVDEMALL
jgi:hypothetical protein